MADDYETYSDEQLLRTGSPQAMLHLTHRLKVALVAQQESTNTLTERIRRLNLWLLWFTVAIFALTAVQALTGLGLLRRWFDTVH